MPASEKGMDEYRGAVSGAAVCVAAIRAAAALSLPINVSAVLPLCENMPSGMATKPGDVVTLLNGKTMRIKDISLAGTVLLADPLLYAQSTFKPKLVVEVGSMASGIRKGLGASATGLWTNNSFLWKNFQKAGALTGDRLWRMPLWRYFRKLVAPVHPTIYAARERDTHPPAWRLLSFTNWFPAPTGCTWIPTAPECWLSTEFLRICSRIA